jgi:hypothetical protein
MLKVECHGEHEKRLNRCNTLEILGAAHEMMKYIATAAVAKHPKTEERNLMQTRRAK